MSVTDATTSHAATATGSAQRLKRPAFARARLIKIALAALVATLIAFVSSVGYRQYETRKFVQAVRPYIKNSSLRLANELRYVRNRGAMTTGEMFERLNQDVSETDKNILQIQTLATTREKALADPALAYLQSIQELNRRMVGLWRQALTLNSDLERMHEAIAELNSANQFTYKYYSEAYDKASTHYEEVRTEEERDVELLAGAAEKLKGMRSRVENLYGTDVIIDATTLDVFRDDSPDARGADRPSAGRSDRCTPAEIRAGECK